MNSFNLELFYPAQHDIPFPRTGWTGRPIAWPLFASPQTRRVNVSSRSRVMCFGRLDSTAARNEAFVCLCVFLSLFVSFLSASNPPLQSSQVSFVSLNLFDTFSQLNFLIERARRPPRTRALRFASLRLRWWWR
jgi:hypothetical protein